MESILIYYPFEVSNDVDSGSKIRPQKMIDAFKVWGSNNNLEVIVISGNSKERQKKFENLLKANQLNNLLFCYMENQTIPIWLTDKNHLPQRPFIDKKVLKYLKNRNVPVGLFYRDVYWKFDELYPLSGIKKKIMIALYKLEEKFLERYIDTLFLPSMQMAKYVDIDIKKSSLPPGGKLNDISFNVIKGNPTKAVYVGAIKNIENGVFLLLDALEIVNDKQRICELTIVCREKEFNTLTTDQKSKMNKLGVNVLHISGSELDELYKDMDFALIPRYKSTYNDFSVPVKLVEYLSNCLPVVATNCDAQSQFIKEGKYGLICKDDEHSLAEAILAISKDIDTYQEEIKRTFDNKHSWYSRVEKVYKTLKEQ